jgi:hypothetical protein
LVLDGHSSHINITFIKFCTANDIILYCLPPHSIRLQPLDFGLFAPLQKYYGKAVEDYFPVTGVGISYGNSLQLYKKVRPQAYTLHNIEAVFRTTGICPFNSRAIMAPTDHRIQSISTENCHYFLLIYK